MKLNNLKKIFFLTASLIIIPALQSCAKLDIKDVSAKQAPASLATPETPAPPTTPAPVVGVPPEQPSEPACHTQLINTVRTVKILFLIDTSGSNDGSTGTDSGKKWRSNVLQTFINSYKSKPNIYYGLATFQGDSVKSHILVNNTSAFTNNLSLVDKGIQSFRTTPDQDTTPYKPALILAKKMISDDLKITNSKDTLYYVVMISDGGATDYIGPDYIIPDINNVVSLAPKQISMNSVYYYGSFNDASQTKYLQNIANIGQGNFITANSSESLKIDDILTVPTTVCQ
ncbi:MAG: VWA domain-containing protein [Pseudobdellovibrio sp.]